VKLRPASALALTVATVASVTLSSLMTTNAHASQPEPSTDWSWYVNTTSTSSLYQLGYNQGSYDKSAGNVNSQVVLDFGGQENTTSTYDNATGITFSNNQVAALMEAFANGYWNGTGSDYIHHIPCGRNTCSWASQIQVWGANDFETFGGAYASDALAWEKGWEQQPSAESGQAFPYLNYGSLDGCPPYGGCSGNGWTQSAYFHLSWGASPAFALPEIYYQSQTNEWVNLSQWGYNNVGGDVMQFNGPLDEYDLNSSTFSSSAAWNSLVSGLSSCGYRCNSNMYFQDQIHVG
jgi:hypothetical protein